MVVWDERENNGSAQVGQARRRMVFESRNVGLIYQKAAKITAWFRP